MYNPRQYRIQKMAYKNVHISTDELLLKIFVNYRISTNAKIYKNEYLHIEKKNIKCVLRKNPVNSRL